MERFASLAKQKFHPKMSFTYDKGGILPLTISEYSAIVLLTSFLDYCEDGISKESYDKQCTRLRESKARIYPPVEQMEAAQRKDFYSRYRPFPSRSPLPSFPSPAPATTS
jgi:hypothetical protein